MATFLKSKSDLAWFKPCPGCAGERPATVWCEPCKAGFCVEDFDARHSVGAFRTHQANAAKICRELKLNCHDCGDSKALPSLVFCHTCDFFLCDACDQYCHSMQANGMVHDRQRYEIEAGGWVFHCTGCSPEQRAAQDPVLWCYDCGKAYCQEHCKRRHDTGKFRKHTPQIEPISAQLKLPCNDCKDVFAADSLEYCHECKSMFCKICCRFRHNDLPSSEAHSISSYYKTGVVRTISEPQDFFSKVNYLACKLMCSSGIGGSSDKAQAADGGEGVRRLWEDGSPREEALNSGSEQEIPPEEDTPPTAKPPPQSAELQIYLDRLREGIFVTRYSKLGESKSVSLALVSEDRFFSYHPVQRTFSMKDPGNRRLAVERVVEVRAGTDPDPEYPEFGGTPVLRQGCKPLHANRALSLIAEFPRADTEEDEDEEEAGPQVVTWDFGFANAQDAAAALRCLREFVAHTQETSRWEAAQHVEAAEEGGEAREGQELEGVADAESEQTPSMRSAPSARSASLGIKQQSFEI